MKTATYELTPEDHLSPDGSQERIIDPKKAAYMGHAAHLAFRYAEAHVDARNLMKRWNEDGDSLSGTADAIYEAAVERAGKRIFDTGDIDKLDYHSGHLQGIPKMPKHSQNSDLIDGIDQDMVVADQALQLARYESDIDNIPMPEGVTRRDETMNEKAERAGERYDRVMGSLSRRFKDVDLS